MLLKSLFFITTLFFTLSLQAFSLSDATSAISTIAPKSTQKDIPSTSKKSSSASLIGMLTNQLGVTDTQASGGVGSILSYAQKELPKSDYTTVANAIPNASSLLSMAPKTNSAIGNTLGSLGGTNANMATLTSQFSSLGLNSSMITQFVPIILDYFKKSNTTDAMSIFSKLF